MRILRGAKTARRGPHDRLVSIPDVERTVFRVHIFRLRCMNNESTVETFASSQPVFRYLVAHRTRHTIFGFTAFRLLRIEWKMLKDLTRTASQLRFESGDRHMTNGALVLD